MSDLSIVAANVNGVVAGNGYADGIGNAPINIGQACYQNSGDQKWYPGNSSTAQTAGSIQAGIALNSISGAGQPVRFFQSGKFNPGNSGMIVGQTYVYSANTGNIAPNSDLATGNYVTIIGTAISASQLQTPKGGISPMPVAHV